MDMGTVFYSDSTSDNVSQMVTSLAIDFSWSRWAIKNLKIMTIKDSISEKLKTLQRIPKENVKYVKC